MKYTFLLLIFPILVIQCSKKNTADGQGLEKPPVLVYDTTAIDSFSAGAVSVDVADRIKKSSVAYQDSLKQVQIEAEEAKKLAEEKAQQEKTKKEEEKKKEEKKEKKDTPPTTETASENQTPN